MKALDFVVIGLMLLLVIFGKSIPIPKLYSDPYADLEWKTLSEGTFDGKQIKMLYVCKDGRIMVRQGHYVRLTTKICS